jgi:hypothetical protein
MFWSWSWVAPYDQEIIENLHFPIDEYLLDNDRYSNQRQMTENHAALSVEDEEFLGMVNIFLHLLKERVLFPISPLNMKIKPAFVSSIPTFSSTPFNNIPFENSASKSVHLKIYNSFFLIPPNSKFLISELSDCEHLKAFGLHDLLIMDPPWPNASVARSKSYHTIDIYDLYKIPIHSLLNHDGVIAIWITNHVRMLCLFFFHTN